MRFFILFFALLIAACATQQKPTTLIPIPVPRIAPSLPAPPYLPIKGLNAYSEPSAVMQAYVVSTKILLKDNEYLRTVCAH